MSEKGAGLWTLPRKRDRIAAARLIHAMNIFMLHGYDVELSITDGGIDFICRYRARGDEEFAMVHDIDFHFTGTSEDRFVRIAAIIEARALIYGIEGKK